MTRNFRKIWITDPAFVKSHDEFELLKRDGSAGIDKTVGAYVPLVVTEELFQAIPNAKLVPSTDSSDETFYLIGEEISDPAKYAFIGAHQSDSGMTCIISCSPSIFHQTEVEATCSPFSLESADPINWTEFAIFTLDQPATYSAPDEYPLYRFFGKIPEADSVLAVQAAKKAPSDLAYSSLILRSFDLLRETS